MEGPLAANLHSSLQELHSENEFKPLSVPLLSIISLHSTCYVYKSLKKKNVPRLNQKDIHIKSKLIRILTYSGGLFPQLFPLNKNLLLKNSVEIWKQKNALCSLNTSKVVRSFSRWSVITLAKI